jgi:type IV secretory pathway TrbD component
MRIITYTAPIRPAVTPLAKPEKSTAIFAGWLLLAIGLGVAFIPGLGLSIWLLSIPVCTAAGLLGIIGAAKGRAFAGVFLIIGSMLAFVVFLILPWISALLGVGLASAASQ